MSDILSQREIDELLNALSAGQDGSPPSGPAKAMDVRPYDFRTANKFSKEQIRMLHTIYEDYATRLSTFLSGTLRTMSTVEVVSIEEQTFQEFINSLPSPVCLCVLSMKPMAGPSLLEVSPVVAYEIISRLFGGTGQMPEPGKSFTEIELSVLMRILRQMLTLMSESWERVVKIVTLLERIETSAQFAQVVPSGEPIAILKLNVRIGEVEGILHLCIPHMAIQPIAKLLAMRTWYTDTSSQADGNLPPESATARLANMPLTLRAVFDTTTASVGDILHLGVGDVIRIEHHVDKPITVLVEHIPKFTGFIGLKGQRVAVKILDIIKEETKVE